MLDGHVDIICREKVEGWLVDRAAPEQAPSVVVLVDGHEVGRCRADLPHGKAKPPAEGAERCGFAFEFRPPLSIFRAHRIEVRHAGTGAPVRNGVKTCHCPANGRMPLAPILVTSRGRAGTTLLMKEFVAHPDIVAADIYPYEVKLADYYAAAYKVLVSHKYPGDPKGMDAVEQAKRLMTVAGNPYNNPGRHRLGAGDSLAEIFEQDFAGQLCFLFRDTIHRYYRALAHTYRKPQARFFAEKNDIDADTRLGVRMLLGELREIVMIRDPRDFLCSAKAFWQMTTEQALDTVAYTVRRLEEIAAEQRADTLIVRYEDLVQAPAETRQAIARFTGLESLPPPDAGAEAALRERHATSASVERSIGRWQSDLDAAEIAACTTRFASFMARFGYAGGTPAVASPAPAATAPATTAPAAPAPAAPAPAAPAPAAPAPAAPAPAAPAPATTAAAVPHPPEPGPAVVAYDLADFAGQPGQPGQPSAPGRPVAAAPVLATTFGRYGDASRYQDAGWANAEHGFTWTNASQSELRLPPPSRPGSYLLRIHVTPFIAAGRLAQQRIAVAANGVPLGEASLARPSVLDCRLDWQVLSRADPVRLSFSLPDAARPTEVTGHANDSRLLGASFQRLWLIGPLAEAGAGHPAPPPIEPAPIEPASIAPAPIAPAPIDPARSEPAPSEPAPSEPARGAPAPAAAAYAKIMLRFESLGENCEFGLVQRRCGVEPLGLFRFASAPLPLLMNALARRFEGMGAPENLVAEVANGREYMVFEKRFQFRYHAWVQVDEKTPAELLEREARRLPFLVRKLLADLEEGAKIFVFHGMQPLAEAEAAGLSRAIRSFGPGTLLWVERADAANPPGSVRRLGDGLLKGHMDRFAPGENAHDISLACWTTLCGAALEAMAEQPAPELARA